MKKKLIIGISICLFIITLVLFSFRLFKFDNANLIIKDGVGTITKNQLQSIVELNGDWEFYPDQLLSPS